MRGGWPRLRRVAATATKSGAGWATVVAVLLGLGRGWNQIPQKLDVILVFGALGVLLGIVDHLLTDQRVVLGEEGVTVREGSSSHVDFYKEYPRSAVGALSIRCWQKTHLLIGVQWHADLELHWADGGEAPVSIRGTAVGVERSAERLAQLYPVVAQDIPLPRPGTSEKERAEKEHKEIAQLREKGFGYVCWRCGILPTTATLLLGFPLLIGWQGGWQGALVGLLLAATAGPVFGCIAGFVGWCVLDVKSEILDQEWPAEFPRIEGTSPVDPSDSP